MSNKIEIENEFTVESDLEEILDEPPKYTVLMMNDHFTTMDFVIEMLMKYFSKDLAEASEIMMNIHKKGSGTCGSYPLDIAKTKIKQVHNSARKAGFPLKCIIK